MKIVIANPPILNKVIAAGMNPDMTRTIFTYGDTIYNPANLELSQDLIIHEQTHRDQQGDEPELWWDIYIKDPAFRVKKELEAYGAQYVFYCKNAGNRNKRRTFLFEIAKDFASPTYGGIISVAEAQEKIKNLRKETFKI